MGVLLQCCTILTAIRQQGGHLKTDLNQILCAVVIQGRLQKRSWVEYEQAQHIILIMEHIDEHTGSQIAELRCICAKGYRHESRTISEFHNAAKSRSGLDLNTEQLSYTEREIILRNETF